MILRETFRVALAALGGLVGTLIANNDGGWREALLAAAVTYVMMVFAWPPYRDKSGGPHAAR